MNESRFQNVVMLDDGYGAAEKLMAVLAEAHPLVQFHNPGTCPTSIYDFPPLAAKLSPLFQANSLLVGIGLAGLLAMTVQERAPDRNLSAFIINPPSDTGFVGRRHPERVVLYSSQRNQAGSDYADLSFDVPWLSGGVQGAIYRVSYLISAYMRGLDLRITQTHS